jgi:threonyl-tRNA synthetase
MPERLDAEFVGEDGGAIAPSCCTAPSSALERFIGILIEQHAGALPAWLAPVQVACSTSPTRRPTMCGSCAKLQKHCRIKALGGD